MVTGILWPRKISFRTEGGMTDVERLTWFATSLSRNRYGGSIGRLIFGIESVL